MWFRNPKLYQLTAMGKTMMFDGVPVTVEKKARGFRVRDAAVDTDFVSFDKGGAVGLSLTTKTSQNKGKTFIEGKLIDTTGMDRAVTLLYTLPIEGNGWEWLADTRRKERTSSPREYIEAVFFRVGSNGRSSRYPVGWIARGDEGQAVAIDMAYLAFYRVGYNAASRELFIAYDFGLVPERPYAEFRFCFYEFEREWGFRSALQKFHETFLDYSVRRTPEQGVWMPFYRISRVKGWQDFGFGFKAGTNESAWDDQHGIITFRYTGPHPGG